MRTVFLLAFAFIGIKTPNQNFTPTEKTFAYHAETTLYNSVSKNFVSRFDIFATLIYQTYENHTVIKLNNVKISAFNGNQQGIGNFPKMDVQDDGKVIKEPFIYYHDQQLAFKENDSYWSINMKRAIASILHIDTRTITNRKIHVNEVNTFGNCDVKYNYVSKESDQVLNVEKIIDMSKCRNKMILFWPENRMTTCRDYDFMKTDIKRSYYFRNKDNLNQTDRIQSTYSLVFKDAPESYHQIEMIQQQSFDLTYYGDIQNTIDISEVTKKKDIKFEGAGVARKFPDFKKQLTESTFRTNTRRALTTLKNELVNEHTDWTRIDSELDRFLKNFAEHSDWSLKETLEHYILYYYDDEILKDFLLSVLPYEGNEDTVKIIKKLLTSEYSQYEQMNLEVTQKLRLLITYPRYLTKYYAKYHDYLLDLKQEDQIVQNAAVLTHSQLVKTAHEMVDKEFKENIDNYLQVYRTSDNDFDYETRMICLLGLYNMNATLDVWMPIIMNSHESRHLRLIAIKSSLKRVQECPLQVKRDFMSLLKNESLHFELRVAALDILLESHLPIEEYDEIYEYLKEEYESLSHQHLYKYFYTTLQSNNYKTKCYTQLYDLSVRYFKKLKFPTSMKTWMTTNYKSSFVNDGLDYGSMHEIKITGAPNTGGVETFQVTFESFAMNMDQKYSLHVTSHGVLEGIMRDFSKISVKNEKYIDELLKILKDSEARLMESTDFHLDVILLINDRASFAVHFNPYTLLENFKKAVMSIPKMIFRSSAFISYPAMNYVYIPSDLGTNVEMVLEERSLKYYKNDVIQYEETSSSGNYTFRYSDHWSISRSLSTLNPISNMKHSAISKLMLYYNQKIPLGYKKNPDHKLYLEIFNQDLRFSSTRKIVRKTLVDDNEKLRRYCQECSEEVFYVDKYKGLTRVDQVYPLFSIDNYYKFVGSRPSEDEFIGNVHPYGLVLLTLGTVKNHMSFPISHFYHILENKIYRTIYNPSWYVLSDYFEINGSERNEPVMVLTFDARRSTIMAKPKDKLPGEYAEVSFQIMKYYVGVSKPEFSFNVTKYIYLAPNHTNTTLGIFVELVGKEGTKSYCLSWATVYPDEPVDMYSLKLAKPVTTSILLHTKFGPNDFKKMGDKCPSDSNLLVNISGKYSVLEKQKEHHSFQKCLKDSVGKKFNVPTEDCRRAANEINTYRGYEFEGHLAGIPFYLTNISNFAINVENLVPKIQLQIKTFRPEISEIVMYPPLDRRSYGEYLLVNSRENFNPHMISSSSCDISSNFVKTFNGNLIKNYDKSSEMVAWIECEKGTSGLTYKVRKDDLLEMTSWIIDKKVVVKPEGTGLKVLLDDKEFLKGSKITEDIFQMYYLADNVLYIHGKYLHVYYNPEYIVSEIIPYYNGMICGICSPMENIMKITH